MPVITPLAIDGAAPRMTTNRMAEVFWPKMMIANGTQAIDGIVCRPDRKSTRLNSSHGYISYAVFCLKKRAMAKAGKGLLEGTLQAGTSAVSDKLLDLVGLGGKSAADKGKDTRDYLAAAFPELNAWERAGADASSAGMVDAGFENQIFFTKMQLANQKAIAEMHNVPH